MATTPIFVGTIENEKVVLNQPKQYASYVAAMKDGQTVKVTVKPFKAGDRIRSIEANAYYWAVVIEYLRQEFGYEKEEMHDALGIHFRRDFSDQLQRIVRTSTMASEEFWEYIERVRRWAATEYNIYIPDPNQVEFGGK